MFPPTVSDNLRYLQQQINRISTAPMGPNSVGPEQGHIRFYDASGDTFHIEPTGALVKHRGGMTALTPLLEGHTATQEAHAARLTTYGEAITSLGTRVGQTESDVAAHGDRLNGYGTAITGLGTRMGQAESDIGAQATRLTGYGTAITGLGTRMGAAETSLAAKAATSYVDSVSSRTTTAQARADAAHAVASARATVAYVDTKASTAALASNVAQLSAAIRKVAQNTGTPDPFLN